MKRKNIKAQAAIEFSLALIVLFIFLLGAFRLFVWLNRNLVYRQENYAATRRLAGDPRVMRTQNPVALSLYADEEAATASYKNALKNIVVNEFYVDKDRLPLENRLTHDVLTAATEDELNRSRAPGMAYGLHDYKKFEMFSGAE